MDTTINDDSSLGKRLKRITRQNVKFIIFMGKTIPLVAKLTIGRDRSNSILIDDRMASRFHAVIQKIKDGFYIKDLNSTNGTFVNDDQIPFGKYIKLCPEDVIRIGRTEFTLK